MTADADTEDGQTPRCGFGLADGSMCLAPALGDREFCRDHASRICDGCHRRSATHECSHEDSVDLCEGCVHISATQHGIPQNPRETVRDELITAVRLVLGSLNESEVLPSTRPQREQAAPQIVEALILHTTLKVLAGLAKQGGTK